MKTLALVIGNNEYPGSGKLDNAINDASAISDVFERLGYQVIYKSDCNSTDYSDLLEAFEAKIVDADASIFYFAGHAFEFQGENYLTSIESPMDSPTIHTCNRTCIRLSEITDLIKRANTKVNIIIIDACRKSFDRGISTSLAHVTAPQGTIIAFSTSPGEGASDAGIKGHSLYTGALLQYIGRELLSVEELFKKTRKTVYTWSSGTQTSWEHTSLVDDFYFNTGQLVHSVEIPYDETAVKDRLFSAATDCDVDSIIKGLNSCNWNSQNPAMVKFRGISPASIDKSKKFLIGRNILQCSPHAFEAKTFIDNLSTNLKPYSFAGQNDVLNGILFEIYFDNNGDFRRGRFKNHFLDEIFKLKDDAFFASSFSFINEALAPYKDELHYIPSKESSSIDVNILASAESFNDAHGNKTMVANIESMTVNGKDITESIKSMCGYQSSFSYLTDVISNYLAAPASEVNLNSNVPISKFTFNEE